MFTCSGINRSMATLYLVDSIHCQYANSWAAIQDYHVCSRKSTCAAMIMTIKVFILSVLAFENRATSMCQ